MNRKSSEIGTASLFISLILGFTEIVPRLGISPYKYTPFIIFLKLFLSLLALILGIGGLFQKERDKYSSVMGTIFSLALLGWNGYLLFFLSIAG